LASAGFQLLAEKGIAAVIFSVSIINFSVARMGRGGTRIGCWWQSQRERGRQEDQDWIVLGWILERWDGVIWTGLVWLRIGTGGALVNSVLNLQVP
jgi:hypothetical protein